MKKIHTGTVTKGRFHPDNRTALNLEFSKREGKRVNVTVSTYKKHRSNPQNSYYFKVVVGLIAEEIGDTLENTHEALKAKFLYDMSGELPKVRSTTDLSTVEFDEYMEAVKRWASEYLNIYIPDPELIDITSD